MKKNLIWAMLISPLFLAAQDQGIAFEHNLSWQQVLQKAKTLHKYIFLDCYASWCGPCKLMDKEVYANDTVGKRMNAEFISVKLQMDTTKQDSQEVQSWYATTHAIQRQYSIYAYPSFLFFSPDGQILHKEIGAKDVAKFIELAKTVIDPQQQYYTLLNKYQQGTLGYARMPGLAKTAKKLGEDSIGMKVAGDYIRRWLETLPEDQLWTKESVAFVNSWRKLLRYDEKIFQCYFRDRKQIDSLMNIPDYTDGLINYMVYTQEITPNINSALEQNAEPDWKGMEKIVTAKYSSDYVVKNMLKGRVEFYKSAKEWHNYAKYLVLRGEDAEIIKMPAGIVNFMLLDNWA